MSGKINLLVLLGAPGSGKGTVAQHLAERYDICYFSTGNLLRNEVKEKTDLGRKVEAILEAGNLVGDDVMNEMVKTNIEKVAASGKVILLDGYPRTKNQAEVLDKVAAADSIRVIELDVDADEVVARISKRRVCAKCGATYGPMDKAEVCSCGGELIKRTDDEESVVRNRLNTYKEKTLPVSAYYSDRIIKICGKGTPEEVARKVNDCLRGLGIEKRR
ncbi:MAG: nucleoside monophosphate kinase [Holosporaceae bacterium]|jgi:adenylate kinase|nr:nucleoside monophosphate kinase [Holosporaceae bacterium]